MTEVQAKREAADNFGLHITMPRGRSIGSANSLITLLSIDTQGDDELKQKRRSAVALFKTIEN